MKSSIEKHLKNNEKIKDFLVTFYHANYGITRYIVDDNDIGYLETEIGWNIPLDDSQNSYELIELFKKELLLDANYLLEFIESDVEIALPELYFVTKDGKKFARVIWGISEKLNYLIL